jgi:hypothetical protein
VHVLVLSVEDNRDIAIAVSLPLTAEVSGSRPSPTARTALALQRFHAATSTSCFQAVPLADRGTWWQTRAVQRADNGGLVPDQRRGRRPVRASRSRAQEFYVVESPRLGASRPSPHARSTP